MSEPTPEQMEEAALFEAESVTEWNEICASLGYAVED